MTTEQHGPVTLHHGDCLDVLRGLPDASVDAVCTDPPYGLEFMGKEWDAPWKDSAARFREATVSDAKTDGLTRGSMPDAYRAGRPFQQWCQLWAAECLRVLKPGGHMLAFGGTRTWHRLACAVEDAGFEVRDSIAWLYGSGFPKSLDVSKAIDKVRDWSLVERLAAEIRRARAASGLTLAQVGDATLAATDGQYGTWYHRGGHMFFETGRSLPSRPEWKHLRHILPIAPEFAEVYDEAEREVLSERTTSREDDGWAKEAGSGMFQAGERTIRETAPATDAARTWQGWGTALKPAFEPVVVARKPLAGTVAANVLAHGTGALNIDGCRIAHDEPAGKPSTGMHGRRAGIMGQTVERHRETTAASTAGRWPANVVLDEHQAAELDQQSGESASRVGKPRGADHGDGWGMTATGAEYDDQGGASRFFYTAKAPSSERVRLDGTAHPTVKPLDLMRWLVRLVTPPGGVVLEPFAGSGTTAEACLLEGFSCIAIEREADYLPLIRQRLNRRRDPVAAVKAAGDDGGLFDLLDEALA